MTSNLGRIGFSVLLALATSTISATEITHAGGLKIIDPWASVRIGGGRIAKLFFQIENHGASDRLLGARSSVASGATTFQRVDVVDGQAVTTAVEAVDIPNLGRRLEFSEQGYFLQLTETTAPLVAGAKFEVELIFENGGPVLVEFTSRFHAPDLGDRIRGAIERGAFDEIPDPRSDQ
ncbi:MAG: copper chaperone PCu(A)C [Pseudomonadota bacterium]